MHGEGGGDRWSIGDLRSEGPPMRRVDRLLAGAQHVTHGREGETRLERLEHRVDEIEHHVRTLAGRARTRAPGYVLFLPGSRGYEIVEDDGVPPAVGAAVVLGGSRFVVEGMRRSPFPADSRPCLVLAADREEV